MMASLVNSASSRGVCFVNILVFDTRARIPKAEGMRQSSIVTIDSLERSVLLHAMASNDIEAVDEADMLG